MAAGLAIAAKHGDDRIGQALRVLQKIFFDVHHCLSIGEQFVL
jgi:hypothetical protein